MLPLAFRDIARPRRILCLGAHADDIEIGCGGTLLALLEGDAPLEVQWVVCSADGLREREARASAERFLGSTAASRVVVEHFRDGFFPFEGARLKEFFEATAREFAPDLIFTHHRGDRHQDHQLVSDLTWQTFRDHLIFEYEIPKYDGDLGRPELLRAVVRSSVSVEGPTRSAGISVAGRKALVHRGDLSGAHATPRRRVRRALRVCRGLLRTEIRRGPVSPRGRAIVSQRRPRWVATISVSPCGRLVAGSDSIAAVRRFGISSAEQERAASPGSRANPCDERGASGVQW